MAIRSATGGHASDHWTARDHAGWIDSGWIGGMRGPTRIDPYFAWAEATEFAYLNGRPEWYPLILRVSGRADAHARSAAQFAERIAALRGDAEHFWIEIPSVYRYPPAGLEETTCFTAIATREFFDHVTREQWLRDALAAFELCLPVVASNDFAATPAPRVEMRKRPGVVVGIIDDGLAYVHERFHDFQPHAPGPSRIDYFWDQEPVTGASVTPGYGSVPSGLGYGWELAKETAGGVPGLDALIGKTTHPPGVLDDDEAYRLSAVTARGVPANASVRRRRAHGTHVMDLACGGSPGDTDPAHRIIAVQLPSRTTRDTSGATLAKQALDAMRYILARAQHLAVVRMTPDWPVVVNLSYGMIAGPHDGTGLLEHALDEMIAARPTPLAVVLPEGNSHLSRCHAQFALAAGGRRTLQWRVLPDDATPSFMEIWLPRAASGTSPPQVEVQVTTPSGETSPWVTPGTIVAWQPTGNNVLSLIAYFPKVAQSDRSMILVCIAPTTTHHPSADVAPSGLWEVAVQNTGNPVTVDAWIQRDDTPFGYPIRGRQSRFDDPAYEYRDPINGRLVETYDAAASPSCVRRAGTQNAIATGCETVVVGGFRRSDWRAAAYSSSGPILPPRAGAARTRAGPDALSVDDDASAQFGVLAAGTRCGSVFAMNGTSVAAPQVTRWIANAMVPGIAKPVWQYVDQMAAAAEAAPPPSGPLPGQKPPLPAQRKGYGRVAFAPLVHRKNSVRRDTPR